MQIHFILGTDEENDWRCMKEYFAQRPMPDLAFSPDSEFPLINGEKGIFDLPLSFHGTGEGGSAGRLLSLHSGIRSNIVPEQAQARLAGAGMEALARAWQEALNAGAVRGSAQLEDGVLTLSCLGHSAHGAEPELGCNAATTLAHFLTRYDLGGANAFLHFLGQILHEDFYGEKLGIAHQDEIMGRVSVNPGLIDYSENRGSLLLNIRYPRGTSLAAIRDCLEAQAAAWQLELEEPRNAKDVHYIPADDPLVKTLLAVYREHTGDASAPLSIGGITYAHVIPHGLAFGMTMPDSDDVVIHQPNECLILEDLQKATAIYADAIYRLVK